jgi:hypothetical protein
MKKILLGVLVLAILATSSHAGKVDQMMREKITLSAVSSDRYPPAIGYGAEYEEAKKSMPLALFLSSAVPGAGEYYLGSRSRSKVFLGIEVAAWASYLAFTYQGRRVRDNYKLFASANAGAYGGSESELYWNAVEWNATNEAYNEGVREDARALYPDDWEKQQQYIKEHVFEGDLAWSWENAGSIEEFRRLRRESRNAFQYAVYSTGFALLNRLASLMDVIVINRSGGKKPPLGKRVELKIEPGEDLASFRVGLALER